MSGPNMFGKAEICSSGESCDIYEHRLHSAETEPGRIYSSDVHWSPVTEPCSVSAAVAFVLNMWTCPSDRREVQEHHCERREPRFEEEDQWADSGEPHFHTLAGLRCLQVTHTHFHTPPSSLVPSCRTTSGWNRSCWSLRPMWRVCTVRWTRWRQSSQIKASAQNGDFLSLPVVSLSVCVCVCSLSACLVYFCVISFSGKLKGYLGIFERIYASATAGSSSYPLLSVSGG